jgi:hypothetical protein
LAYVQKERMAQVIIGENCVVIAPENRGNAWNAAYAGTEVGRSMLLIARRVMVVLSEAVLHPRLRLVLRLCRLRFSRALMITTFAIWTVRKSTATRSLTNRCSLCVTLPVG